MKTFIKTQLLILSLLAVSFLARAQTNQFEYRDGGIVRGPKNKKQIALEFTADTFSKGSGTVLNELEKHGVKGSFFLTGNFLRKAENKPLIERIIRGGHYLGPHSDAHPLYCPWDGEKKTLVSKEAFTKDLEKNLKEIERCGVERSKVRFWIPPYEHYNKEIVEWSRGMGMTLINYTSGTRSPADYTEDAAKNFVSAQVILDSIINKEKKEGLNGYLLLLHFGVSPKRSDLMANRLEELLDYLQTQKYEFVRVDEMLAPR